MRIPRLLIFLCLVTLCQISVRSTHAQDSTAGDPPSNLSMYRSLAQEIGMRTWDAFPQGDSISVRIDVQPRESSWFIEEGVIRAASIRGLHPSASADAEVNARFGIDEMAVRYDNIRRDGFLGRKIVDRKVLLTLSVAVADQRNVSNLLRAQYSATRTDTIALDAVESVEHANVPSTRGKLPDEGFFSSIAEPVLLVGAVALAVYLLFSVRS